MSKTGEGSENCKNTERQDEDLNWIYHPEAEETL